jgi:hypothetical protein
MAIPSLKSYSGGKNLDTTETQTGDPETVLQEIKLPDADGVYNIIGRVGVSKKDAADEYAAIKRFDKTFRKAGGSIQEIVDHSDSESFLDLVGGLFSSGDLTLKDGSNGLGLYGGNPEVVVQAEPTLEDTFDISSFSGVQGEELCVPVTEVDGTNHFIFSDSDLSQLSEIVDGAGSKIQVSSKTADSIDAAIGGGEIHVVFEANNTDIYYTKKTFGGAWSNDELIKSDSEFLEEVRVEVDSNGIPYVIWENFTTENIDYADRVGGSWSVDTNIDNATQSATSPIDFTVRDNGEIGFAFNNEDNNFSITFGQGTPGSFSFTSDVLGGNSSQGLSVAVKDDTDYIIAGTDSGTQQLTVSIGNASAGFTQNQIFNYGSGESSLKDYDVIAFNLKGTNFVLAVGNPDGSNPYNARLFEDSGGSWSFSKELTTFSNNWSNSLTDYFISISDNSNGNKVASIRLSQLVNAALKYNTGAEVTNA